MFLFVYATRSILLIRPLTLVLVVTELVVEAIVVLLVNVVLLMVVIQCMRSVSRAMMTLMMVIVLLHPSIRLMHLAFNSLDITRGVTSPQHILFLNFFFPDSMANSIVYHRNS